MQDCNAKCDGGVNFWDGSMTWVAGMEVPTTDADGNKLDKKTMARLKKDRYVVFRRHRLVSLWSKVDARTRNKVVF